MSSVVSLAIVIGLTALAYCAPTVGAVLVGLCVLYDLSHAYKALTWHAPDNAPYRNPPSLTTVIQPLVYLAASAGMQQPVVVKVLCGALLIVLHILCFAAVHRGTQKQLAFNKEVERRTGNSNWADDYRR